MYSMQKNNFFRPISRKQFIDVVEKFRAAAEEHFCTKCRLEISVLNQPRASYSGTLIAFVDMALALDDKATFYKTENPVTIDAEIWKQAASFKIALLPVSQDVDFLGGGYFDKKTAPRTIDFDIVPHANRRELKDYINITETPKIFARLG